MNPRATTGQKIPACHASQSVYTPQPRAHKIQTENTTQRISHLRQAFTTTHRGWRISPRSHHLLLSGGRKMLNLPLNRLRRMLGATPSHSASTVVTLRVHVHHHLHRPARTRTGIDGIKNRCPNHWTTGHGNGGDQTHGPLRAYALARRCIITLPRFH